jgi:hypothetical protein
MVKIIMEDTINLMIETQEEFIEYLNDGYEMINSDSGLRYLRKEIEDEDI